MCGIAGVVDAGGRVDPDLVRRMTRTLRHRGPDDDGVLVLPEVALGHTRLSIIDIAGGAQPMSLEDGSASIVFNGEIFNYVELREELVRKGRRFRTRSDTEVLLQLYDEEGDACVERLNGQWAFAIWDARRQRLFASRDRMGIRPFFYTETGSKFLFASEIKTLLTSPEVDHTPDLDALDQIFTFWVTIPPRTAFQGIHQLPPGHCLAVEGGRIHTWPYWRLELTPGPAPESEREVRRLAEDLLDLLQDATRLRLRSDVPVGAYLSGGLDSTLIAALAEETAGERLSTFSVGFDESDLDETPHQEAARLFLGTKHAALQCTKEAIAEAFPDTVCHAEQPVLRTAPAPLFMLSGLVRDNDYKVVLTGEGADELFGGYDIFKECKIRQFWGRHPGSAWRAGLLKRLYPYMPDIQRQPVSYLQSFFKVAPDDLESPYFAHLPRWNLTARIRNLLSADVRSRAGALDPLAALGDSLPASYQSLGAFSRAEFLETTMLLPGYLLSSQGDRMSMAHGVEGRYPFLDHRVVEFARKLSPNVKMNVLNEKFILKMAARSHVPESVRQRHKQPYRAPDGASFFEDGPPDYLEDLLSPRRVGEDGIFDPGAVARLVAKFRNGLPTSVADNMALVGVLSTAILVDLFVRNRPHVSLI